MATARAELLRPAPERGAQIAAAVVSLTTLVLVLNGRFEDDWGAGIHLVYTALAAVVVLALAANSPRGERPATWQSVLFIAAFVLVLGTLTNLADVLGADDPPLGASGTTVWIGLLLAALAAWFASEWDSGISTLLCALTLVVVVLSFVDWVFTPEDVDTFRWVLLLIAIAFTAVAAARRDTEPEHAVGFMNAAGVALLALAATFLVDLVFGVFSGAFGGTGSDFEVGWGWELIVLLGAGVLIAWSVFTRQAGPGYLGAANLFAYTTFAAVPDPDGPSLIGWPIVLILLTGGLFAMALGREGPGAAPAAPAGPAPEAPTTAAEPRP